MYNPLCQTKVKSLVVVYKHNPCMQVNTMSEFASAQSTGANLNLYNDKGPQLARGVIEDVSAVADQGGQSPVQAFYDTGAQPEQPQQHQVAVMEHSNSTQADMSETGVCDVPTDVQACNVSSITGSVQQIKLADIASQVCPRVTCQQWTDAAKAGDVQSLHSLYKQHPELLNYQPASGLQCSALHWAAARGHVAAVEHLLDLGANPILLTATGSTCLHSAAAANKQECVELLLQVPIVLQQLDAVNEDGLTAAASAANHGHHMLQSRLLAAAACVRASSSQGDVPYETEIDCRNAPGEISRWQSTSDNDKPGSLMPDKAAQQLLDVASPCAVAAPMADKEYQQDQPDHFQQATVMQATASSAGRSWLDAARYGDLHTMQSQLAAHPELLQYSGTGTSYAFTGNSALHWSAAKGHVGIVRWLLQQGADVHQVNQAGETAVHTAVGHGQAGCAQVLVLQGGADVQVQDGLGQSAVQVRYPIDCLPEWRSYVHPYINRPSVLRGVQEVHMPA